MDLRVGLLSCCFDDIRNAFDRESLCLFFEAELIACLQRRLRCIKHHRNLQLSLKRPIFEGQC